MMISPEDDNFAGEPDAGFLVLHDPIDRFDRVDVRRITPAKKDARSKLPADRGSSTPCYPTVRC